MRSDVEVWPTAGAAARNASAEQSSRGRVCTEHLLERAAIGTMTGRARIRDVRFTLLPRPLSVSGVSDVHAARVSMTIITEAPRGRHGTSPVVLQAGNVRRAHVPLVLETLGFVAGPAEVSLTATGVNGPPSAATERRLLALLYRRATAREL